MVLSQVSQSQDSPLPPPSKTRRIDLQWPAFHNNGITYPTEFVAGSWKCPICCRTAPRIRQHLTSHQDLVQDLEYVETYCKEIAVLKRKELDAKRAKNPGRKEVLKKADVKREPKRAENPERKEVLKKADAKREPKRAENPERKEVLKKADAKREPKRAENPGRKEVLRKADKKREPERVQAVKVPFLRVE